jgi:tetraacyldisaccharide 4'-kinase
VSSRSWRTRLQLTLVEAWQQRGMVAWLAAPAAAVHWLAGRALNLTYAVKLRRPVTLPVPVVVIGNLYVGGTGKTPLTLELVRALRARGWHPGIVSRGYGARSGSARLLAPGDTARDVGDEPLLLAQATGVPVAVGAERAAAARLLLAERPEVDLIVADDGLQHRALARDFEIALLHYRGLGNGWLLPAGPLREPRSRLDRVDAIVEHGEVPVVAARAPRYAMQTRLTHAYALAEPGRRTDLARLATEQRERGWRILAAAGIGMPDRFFAMLRDAGLQIDEMPLADHYEFIINPFQGHCADRILVTEKDAVKCAANASLAADPRLWVVPLSTELDPRLVDAVIERLTQVARRTARGPSPA